MTKHPIPPVDPDKDKLLRGTVKVFRYDPVFETVEKYWMVPLHRLDELYVCTYRLPLDEDGDVIDSAGCLRSILAQHQGQDVVLIY